MLLCGAGNGICPSADGAVARKNNPPDCFLTRALQIPTNLHKKQHRDKPNAALWSWKWDLNPRPIDYESTGLNSPFDTLNIGLYNLFSVSIDRIGNLWTKISSLGVIDYIIKLYHKK